MKQKNTFTRLFVDFIEASFFCLTIAAASSFAQPGDRLSPAAKSDFQKGVYDSCLNEYTRLIAAEPKNDGFYAERSRCHYLKGSGLKTAAEGQAEFDSAFADGG